jgi:hypothetical protein
MASRASSLEPPVDQRPHAALTSPLMVTAGIEPVIGRHAAEARRVTGRVNVYLDLLPVLTSCSANRGGLAPGETVRVFWRAQPPPPRSTRRASIARAGST